jgi:hypothetical protein
MNAQDILEYAKGEKFPLHIINRDKTTVEKSFKGIMCRFDGLWYYSVKHQVPLNMGAFYEAYGKIDKSRGRLSKWIIEAFKEAHPDRKPGIVNRLEECMDTITLVYKLVDELESCSDVTMMVSRAQDEFCRNASNKDGSVCVDERDTGTDENGMYKVSCHRKGGVSHEVAHKLWTIDNYFIFKLHDGDGNLLFRTYFNTKGKGDLNDDSLAIYQTGSYRWNVECLDNYNGYQKLTNIIFSRIFFNRLDTRAVTANVNIMGIGSDANENSGRSKYQTYALFQGDGYPSTNRTLYTNSSEFECFEAGEQSVGGIEENTVAIVVNEGENQVATVDMQEVAIDGVQELGWSNSSDHDFTYEILGEFVPPANEENGTQSVAGSRFEIILHYLHLKNLDEHTRRLLCGNSALVSKEERLNFFRHMETEIRRLGTCFSFGGNIATFDELYANALANVIDDQTFPTIANPIFRHPIISEFRTRDGDPLQGLGERLKNDIIGVFEDSFLFDDYVTYAQRAMFLDKMMSKIEEYLSLEAVPYDIDSTAPTLKRFTTEAFEEVFGVFGGEPPFRLLDELNAFRIEINAYILNSSITRHL